MNLPLGTIALAAVLASPLAAQRRPPAPTPPPAGWTAFVSAFDGFLAADSIVGGAAVLVQDGRIIAHVERGMADRDRGQLVDERTLFHWGSITKTLTAVAVLQLRDRGLLSLDDPVTRWIPELRQVHNPFGSMDAITVRMLLSHASGFQDPTWPWTRGRPWEPFEPTRWEQLVAMMPYMEIRFAPGSRYGYSNPAFIYLARIIEAISGDPWQGYVYKNLWLPLGVTRSYFGATPYHQAADRSNNYTVTAEGNRERTVANGRDFHPGITIPNGGWNGPLSDLAIWAAFLAGAPTGDTATARRYDGVLRRGTLEEMWRPVVPVNDAAGQGMGLSFFVWDHGGTRLVGHTGSQAGFRAFLYVNPVTRDAIIAAVNTANGARPSASAESWRALVAAGWEVVRR
jgi:CubicO group peptidase (beta-lactamase class C family)